MKKQFFLLSLFAGLALGLFALSSCGDDDNEIKPAPVLPVNPDSGGDVEPAFNARTTPLTLEALANGSITFDNQINGDVTYKIDGGDAQVISGRTSRVIPVRAGQKVSFLGDNETYTRIQGDNIFCSTISSNVDFYVYGNIMSLINSENFATATRLTGHSTFRGLFSGNSHLKNNPKKTLVLPATTLTENCYRAMFWECAAMTSAPTLPATTMAPHCYDGMFRGCLKLQKAPDLPATNLADYCYSSMFYACITLNSAPKRLPAMTLAEGCYWSMFLACYGITESPVLPAKTLAEACYAFMFQDCDHLEKVTCYATNRNAKDCTLGWLEGVADYGTFITSPDAVWNRGFGEVPEGWIVRYY